MWKYREEHLTTYGGAMEIENFLNRRVKDGWEVVSVLSNPREQLYPMMSGGNVGYIVVLKKLIGGES